MEPPPVLSMAGIWARMPKNTAVPLDTDDFIPEFNAVIRRRFLVAADAGVIAGKIQPAEGFDGVIDQLPLYSASATSPIRAEACPPADLIMATVSSAPFEQCRQRPLSPRRGHKKGR